MTVFVFMLGLWLVVHMIEDRSPIWLVAILIVVMLSCKSTHLISIK